MGLLAELEGLILLLRGLGARATYGAIASSLESILLRLFSLFHRVPYQVFVYIWEPVLAFLEGLGALAETAAAGAGIMAILIKLLVAAVGLGLGILIGWLILRIPVGGGRTVKDVIEDSFVTDFFWWIYRKATGLDDCEALYAAYVRLRQQRRAMQADGAPNAHIIPVLAAEIAVLQRYLKCLPQGQRGVFERELQRLQTLLQSM